VQRAGDEAEFIAEKRVKLEVVLVLRRQREREINPVVPHRFDRLRVSPGSMLIRHWGKLSLNSRRTVGRI